MTDLPTIAAIIRRHGGGVVASEQAAREVLQMVEAAIRADERDKVEREIAAWLRANPWLFLTIGDPRTGPSSRDSEVVAEVRANDADAIERGKYRGER